MEKEVKPLVNHYWLRDEFPFELIPKFQNWISAGLLMKGMVVRNAFPDGRCYCHGDGKSRCFYCHFFGVQSGLAMGSIYICGSEEQKQKWLPQMQKFEKLVPLDLRSPKLDQEQQAD